MENENAKLKYPYEKDDKLSVLDFKINKIGCFVKFSIVQKNSLKEGEKTKEKNEINIKRHLREFLLDIKGSLSAIGLELPIIAVFEKLDNFYGFWHKIAGDQDWHRGDFSIIVSKNSIFNELVIEKIQDDPNLRFKELKPEKIAEYLRNELKNIKDRDSEKEKYYKKFIKTISESLENNNIEEGFERWKDGIENEIGRLNKGQNISIGEKLGKSIEEKPDKLEKTYE